LGPFHAFILSLSSCLFFPNVVKQTKKRSACDLTRIETCLPNRNSCLIHVMLASRACASFFFFLSFHPSSMMTPTRHADMTSSPQTRLLDTSSNSNDSSTALTTNQQQLRLHALDVSEIRSLISECLTKQELCVCILVCKKWCRNFIPLYWRTIFVQSHKTTRYSESSLRQHGQHIRILNAGRIEETSVFNQSSVNSLQSLDISTCGSKDKEDGGRGCLQEIIYRNRKSLMSLKWRCFGRDTAMERPFRLWPAMFQGLQVLGDIELSNWSLSRIDFLRMLISCPALRNLVFQATEDIQETGGRHGLRSNHTKTSRYEYVRQSMKK
jgi:hypothetical protein